MKRASVAAVLRVAALALVTFVAVAASWQLATAAGIHTRVQGAELALRADPQDRGLSPGGKGGFLDTAGTRLTLSGSAFILTPGLPLTVIDRGTATQTVIREAVPYQVRTVADSSLPAGRVVVSVAGVTGLADNTYRVREVDGAMAERALVASVVVQEPVTEVRRVGTRPPPGPSDIIAVIRSAAATWGADPDQLLRVAYCESRYDPDAYNASSGASGLFQFMPRTWAANSVRAGYGGASVFDPVANANTAASMFANSQAGQWSCK